MRRWFMGLLCVLSLWGGPPAWAGSPGLPSPPLRTAFGSRCVRSPVPCNRIDYRTAHFHIADVILLPATESRGFAATVGYGASMSLFHRLEVGIGGTLSVWSPLRSGIAVQNGPALLNVNGILFPLLRRPVPDSEFTFGLQLQQQLRIPRFDGLNDLGTETPLTALRAVADKPFWRMGITASLGLLLTQGRTDTELSTGIRFHLPWMSRATVQTFGVLQGLFGSKQSAPLRGGFGLSVHFAWDNGTSLSGGNMQGRGDGIAPSAIYIGGPDYHIGRETAEQSYSRPPIPNREMVPSPWPWIWEKLKQEWSEAELANEAHRRGEDWLTDECFLYEEGKYDKPLRHLGKRDSSGKFCNVGGQLVPMDEPLREVGTDLVPVRSQLPQQESPIPSPVPTQSVKPMEPMPATPPAQSGRSGKRKPQQTETSGLQVVEAPVQADSTPQEVPKETPKRLPNEQSTSLGQSARQFARGFGKGVRDETEHMYHDVTELPRRVATTGRELIEDIEAGRKLRALAPIEAIGHAIQNVSREDVQRVAHAVVDGAIDWYHKPAYEKGESLGHATVSVASEVAIAVATDGLGNLATLRKAEKVAEAANHVRDAERVAKALERGEDAARAAQKAKQASQVSGTQRSRMLGESGTQVPSKTVWKQDGARIDVENPNPGKRPGQIHFQQGRDKYLYDPELEEFVDAPRSVNKRLEDARFRQGLDKAMKLLGEDK